MGKVTVLLCPPPPVVAPVGGLDGAPVEDPPEELPPDETGVEPGTDVVAVAFRVAMRELAVVFGDNVLGVLTLTFDEVFAPCRD